MSYTVKIVYEGINSQFWTFVNGVSYEQSTTLTVDSGSTIKVSAMSGSVYLDGSKVADTCAHYESTITSNVTITCSSDYNIYIVTEEASGDGSGGSDGSGGGHKALIGGTAYEISGGKAMVGGTVYDIANGKTLVDGTAYEIAFGTPVTVSITKNQNIYGQKGLQYIEIAGVQYNDLVTLVVDSSESVFLQTYCMVEAYDDSTYISVNGVKVAQGGQDGVGTSGGEASYTLELRGLKTVTIEMIGVNSYAGAILVTTT